MSKRPTLHHPPSSLIKMVESTGRTRGSSATPIQTGPTMLSPQPQRDLQAQIDIMNNDLRLTNIGHEESNRHSTSTNRAGPTQHQGSGVSHQRNESTSTRSVASSQEQGVKLLPKDLEPSAYIYRPNLSQDTGHGNIDTGPGAFQFPARQRGPPQGTSRVSSSSVERCSQNLTIFSRE